MHGCFVGVALVDAAVLAIKPDAESCALAADLRGYARLGFCGIEARPFLRLRSGGGEIEDSDLRPGDAGPNDRCKIMRVLLEPTDDRGRMWKRRQTAGIADAGDGDRPVLAPQTLQFAPDILLADEQVGILGVVADLLGRQAHADGVAGKHQIEDQLDFDFTQAVDLMISTGKCSDGSDRIGRSNQRIGRGDRDFDNAPGLDHVAEVEQTTDLALAVEQHIVVVGVVVNDLHRAGRQARQHR
ncbi:hypothetical protein D9M70_525570 [compost metagenome]